MKRTIVVALLAISLSSLAQTTDNKNNFSAGYGTQCYNGVLENTWFNFEYETYGVAVVNYSRYLCSSFDVTGSVTVGNFGHCRDGDAKYWPDGATELNMLGQLITINASVKYKFTNGYLLKEDAKIAPFIYVGFGVDPILDGWNHRVDQGVYYSLMDGGGIRYNYNEKYSLTYTTCFGEFNNDKMDYGNLYAPKPMKPLYMQHMFTLGINF
ncbi:MAG TPA: hypothetical protein VK553_00575 [Candidatus Nitrosopolaris rasttigaisensis]|nr:hypothetical protein [Candidatus Nitrosopolaris rasttigaisensis]